MDLNNINTLRALPIGEPIQLGGIKVSTNQYDNSPNSLYVMIWDDFRMIEKEYDIHTGLLLSRQVCAQKGDTFGEKRENDQRMHKYSIVIEYLKGSPDVEIYKEYHDGELITKEQRELILNQQGKIAREEWTTLRYNNGIPSPPQYLTINHE